MVKGKKGRKREKEDVNEKEKKNHMKILIRKKERSKVVDTKKV